MNWLSVALHYLGAVLLPMVSLGVAGSNPLSPRLSSLCVQQQYGTYHPGQATAGSAAWAGQAPAAQVARGATQNAPGQHPQSQSQAQAMHQWHIPQHAVPQHGSLGRSGQALNHQDNNSYKITLKTQVWFLPS